MAAAGLRRHEAREHLRRDAHDRLLAHLAPGGARQGPDAVGAVSELPGLRRVEQIMGMPIVVDVRDECSDAMPRRALRLVPRGRRALQHLQGRRARSAASTAASSRSATAIRTSAGCSPAATSCARRPAATSTPATSRCSTVDPSGLVKGWSVDRGGELLERARHPRTTRSTPAATSACAARRSPSPPGAPGSSIRCSTTGSRRSSRRTTSRSPPPARTSAGEHIVDPHSGAAAARAAARSRSPATTSRTADAYATAAYRDGRARARVDGDTAPATRRSRILADGTSLSTPGFPFARDAGTQ